MRRVGKRSARPERRTRGVTADQRVRVVGGGREFTPCVCLAPDPGGPSGGSAALPSGPYLLEIEAGELPVGELVDRVGLSQSALSQHLAKLRAQGLVAFRKQAQLVFYRIADPRAERLLETLKRLRDLGNTVIVVEHDEDAIRTADHIVDLGPGAGVHGGEVVAQGTLKQILKAKGSLTADYLTGKRKIDVPAKRRKGNGHKIVVKNARANNLKGVTAKIPLGTFTCITGVSGSGKSSLTIDTLQAGAARALNGARVIAGAHDAITGLEYCDKVIEIDQSPIGRTPRSNPATYTGLFTPLRELMADVPMSRIVDPDQALGIAQYVAMMALRHLRELPRYEAQQVAREHRGAPHVEWLAIRRTALADRYQPLDARRADAGAGLQPQATRAARSCAGRSFALSNSAAASSGEGIRAEPYITRVEPTPASSSSISGFSSSSWNRTGRSSSRSRNSRSWKASR